MHIIELQSNNVKRLKAVRIKPNGERMIVVGGRNAQGKSSVLDSIQAVLGGQAAVPGVPVRLGEKRASAELVLGDGGVPELTVRRTMNANGGGTLTVRRANGDQPSSPQKLLDDMVGAVSFDPLEFIRSPAKQVAELQRLAGVDMAAYRRNRSALYAMRTEANRQAKEARARAAALREGLPDDLPAGPVSPAELLARLEQVHVHNGTIEMEARCRREQEEQLRLDDECALKLKDQIDGLTKEYDALVQGMLSRRQAIAALPALAEPLSDDDLRAQIANSEQVNAQVRRAAEAAEAEAAAVAAERQSDRLSDQMQLLDLGVDQRIREAHLPVDDLSFSPDGDAILYQGLPLSQASSAEQLRVSVALAIAASPKLRAILIRDGSLLDEDNLAMVGQMAEASGCQVWMERVGAEGASVVIEDGEVVGGDLACDVGALVAADTGSTEMD